MNGQSHATAALTPGKETRYPSYRRAGWDQGTVWTGAENVASAGLRFPGRSSPQQVAIPTELSRPTTATVTPDAPYCNPWPVRLYKIFSHNLIDGTVLKKLLNIKCVFWICLQHLFEKFPIIRRIERKMIINLYWSSCKVPVILVRF